MKIPKRKIIKRLFVFMYVVDLQEKSGFYVSLAITSKGAGHNVIKLLLSVIYAF